MQYLEKIINRNGSLPLKKWTIERNVVHNFLILFYFILFFLINSCGVILSGGKLKDGDFLEFKKNENQNIIYIYGKSEPQKIFYTFEAIGTIIDPVIFNDRKRCFLHFRTKGDTNESLWIIDGIEGWANRFYEGSNTFAIDDDNKNLCIFDLSAYEGDSENYLDAKKLNIIIYNIDSKKFTLKFSVPFYKYPIWYTKTNIEEQTEPIYEQKTNSFNFKIINSDYYIETYKISLDSKSMELINITKTPKEFYFGM